MRLRSVLAAILCLSGQIAIADNIDALSARSAFVSVHNKDLKRNKALAAFASTKAYCPSVYWWSARPSSNADAVRGHRQMMTREMSQAGFGKQAITAQPVLVETNTYGSRSWAIYNSSFQKICTLTDKAREVTLKCPSLGTLKGTSRIRDGRSTLTARNGKLDLMVMTRRGTSFVKSALKQM